MGAPAETSKSRSALRAASFNGKNAFTGMNHSLQQIFHGGKRSGAKKQGKTWDSDNLTGQLWIWTGTFKRWRKHTFSAAQPGLLSYSGHSKRGKKATGESINLHESTITFDPVDPRYFRIRLPTGRVFHLRTSDPSDLEPCIASIKASAEAYKTMLGRASLLAGNLAPGQSQGKAAANGAPGAPPDLQSMGTPLPLHVKLSQGEPEILHQVRNRVAGRMEEIEPFGAAVEDQIQSIQETLNKLSAALNLHPEPPARSHSGFAHHRVEALQRDIPSVRSHERLLEAGLSITRADSFHSVMSELPRSPSSHLASTGDIQGLSSQGALSHAWRMLLYAIEDGYRSEATKLVELQTENDALKAAMRHFKVQAQRNAAKLRSLSPASPAGRGSSDSDDNEELARLNSLEHHSVEELGMRFMSKSLNAECREAIEALEAVQKHAFAVRYTQEGSHADHNEPGPPDVDFEDAGSEDEMHSEPGSRQPSMTHELAQHLTANVWEVAAQRDRLPNPAPLNRGFSIWSVLKSAIGKDLTRITLPATINEPLSALQRIAEDLEYRTILDKALACQDPGIRALLIAAFVASGYSATLKRESKPFNPLLGETFEWQSEDQTCRFFCEQVSHHPPVSCWWSEGVGWQYYGEIELRSKFWGKSVEMLPTGTCWLRLGDELWSWNKANMSINNIIIGTYWLDWYGKITLQNHTTGTSTVMQFPKSSGRNLDQRGVVNCSATSSSGAELKLEGKYTDRLVITDATSNPLQEVFRITPPVEQGALQYNMTRLAMTLNTSERELFKQLPPTDSRFRPDQRALEDAELEKATDEKLRLEEKQREVRKERKETGQPFFPSWFKLREFTPQQKQGADHWLGSQLVRLPNEPPPCLWEFTGEYWACKAKRDWNRCPEIYSGGPDALATSPSEARQSF